MDFLKYCLTLSDIDAVGGPSLVRAVSSLCVVCSVIVDHARAPGERRPPGRGRGGYGYGYGGGYGGGGFGGRSRGGGFDRYSTVTILHCFALFVTLYVFCIVCLSLMMKSGAGPCRSPVTLLVARWLRLFSHLAPST